jgi:hypothetical protein
MSNLIVFKVFSCEDETIRLEFIVDDLLSEIIVNGTYYFDSLDERIPSGCYTVLQISSSVPVEPPNMVLIDTYTDCLDCLTNSSNYVVVVGCGSRDKFVLPISAFTGTLEIGQTYYISFTIKRGDLTITSCFYIDSFLTNYEDEIGEVISISPLIVDCNTCFTGNSFVYEVIDCLEGSSKYIQLSGDYIGHLITYYDPLLFQQFCGVVENVYLFQAPNVTLVSDLGLFIDPIQCEDCLGKVADKRIITNCINGTEQVVWASTLSGSEDYSNLSYELGCYDIGDLTESGVTITSFLNFDPQPSCTDCIECTGIQYNYSSCTNTGPIASFTPLYLGTSTTLTPGYNGPFTGTTDSTDGFGATFYVLVTGSGTYATAFYNNIGVRYEIGDTIVIDGSLFGGISGDDDVTITVTNVYSSGSVISYQYVENPIGTTLYYPYLDDCVEITSYSNPTVTSLPLFSFNSLTDCETCNSSDNFVWLGESCSTLQLAIITTTNGFVLGDIVKVNRGSSEFDCYTLISEYDPSMGNYETYNSLTNDTYQTCDECTLNLRINISIAECDGSNQQYVSISLVDYFMFKIFGYNIFNINQYNKCYTIINTCPINGNYPEINIRSFYYNCDDCVFDNTRQPKSSGTEYEVCEICCDCGSTGSTINLITPPHPVYTDGYGTPVTQLNMVVLGGPNGLNN